MATNASPFIVNIVDLQNIATGISGTSKDSQLAKAQEDIGNIQEMVNYQTKTLSADILTSFTTGQAIDVMANLNLSNTSIYTNSNLVTLNTDTATVRSLNSIGETETKISVNPTAQTISFVTAGTQSFLMSPSGSAQFANDLYVGGNIYATTLIQTSDKELKTAIEPFLTSIDEVLKLEPQRFQWASSGSSDIGFIAQDVQSVWPDLIETHQNGSPGIVYSRFIPLLLECIRELNQRIVVVESALKDHLRK
jgi:hypothetical protein